MINPYSAPHTDFASTPSADATPALWNPSVAAALGFFLTPVFGALINMKNWQAMGEPAKARESKLWAIGTVAFTIAMIVLAFFLPENNAINWLFKGAGLGFFVAWYMTSCKDQKDVITYRYGTDFTKRGWTVPVLCAVGVYIALVVAFVLVIMVFVGVNGDA